MRDPKENEDEIKCYMCKGEKKVTHVLVNKRILNNQRLFCADCYHNYKGGENSKSYSNVLEEVEKKNQQKENQRKTIADQQIKPIKILLQLQNRQFLTSFQNSNQNSIVIQTILNSMKDDLIDKIDNLVWWVSYWIRTIEKIKNDNKKGNLYDEIYSLLFPNYRKDQMEVLIYKRRIKSQNRQFCNQLILAIQSFANASNVQEIYQILVDALFSIEQKIDTNPSDLGKALKNTMCPLHQEPINRVQYQTQKDPISILCNRCENKYGESLETFSKNWSTFLKNKEGRLEKLNQYLKEKIKHTIQIQTENQAKINGFYDIGISNLVQTGEIELQKQCDEIEELKKLELNLKIEIMASSILEYNNQTNPHIDQNKNENENITNSNPIIQIDKILKEQIKKNSLFLNQKSNTDDQDFDLALYRPIQWRLLSQCENESCTAIVFNSSKQLMVTNQGNKINIFQLKNPNSENQLKTLSWERKLQVRKQNNELSVTCMIHSKQYNAFVTADERLVIWKYCDKVEVCQQQDIDQQNGYVNCLVVNKDETQLFSGGQEIQVYNLNFERYFIKYEYSLSEHKGKVLSLSLNDSETYLISYGEDQKIIIWVKVERKWKIKSTIQTDPQEYSNTISFIKNDLFILVTDNKEDNKNRIRFYQKTESDDTFQDQEQLQQKYKSQDVKLNLDQPGFAVIQLINKNLIFIKNRNYIYTMRRQLDGLYETSQKIMQFSSSSIYGNSLYFPEKNELYLVIWDQQLKTYQIIF